MQFNYLIRKIVSIYYCRKFMKKNTDYEVGLNCFLRRVFFIHLYKHGSRAYKAIFSSSNDQPQKEIKQNDLTINDIPEAKQQEDSYYLSEKLESNIQGELEGKDTSYLSLTDLSLALYKTLKSEFLFVVFVYVLGIAVRIGGNFLFQFLIQYLQAGNYTMAYIFAAATAIGYFCDSTIRHNSFYEAPILTGQLKSCVIACIFKKLLSLTQYTANKGSLGKTINMISNDFNLIEIKSPFFFGLVSFPIAYGAIIGVLYYRLGIYGLICVGVVVLFIPIQILIAQGVGYYIQKTNVHKDQRVKITTQMIDMIKFIKINGWELAFKETILKIRDKEFRNLVKLCVVRSIETTLAKFSIYFGALVSLYIKSRNEQLTQAVIFSTLQLMSFMRLYNFFIVMGLGFIFQFRVFLNRFLELYNTQNIRMICMDPSQQQNVNKTTSPLFNEIVLQTINDNPLVKFSNFNGYWKKEEKPTLSNINLNIQHNKFYGLSGAVGSGKTSLFQAILHQLPYYTGSLKINNFDSKLISYCEQEVIIFSSTIKQNIVFNQSSSAQNHSQSKQIFEIDQERYQKVIEVSCLKDDLQLFKNKDGTLVGEKGVTLSGGQRTRVGLARALYKDAQIYLFDDPLSAVDTKVAKFIFQNVFQKFLKEKTVILGTHQIQFLEECDYVIMMQKGSINQIISPKQAPTVLREQVKAQTEQNSQDSMIKQEKPFNQQQAPPEKNQEVTFMLFLKYMFYNNKILFPVIILLYILSQGCISGFIRVLAYYDLQKKGQTDLPDQQALWAIAWSLQGGYFLLSFCRYLMLGITLLTANQKIHEKMIQSLFRSHSWYFDVTPLGQLSNKFSNDVGVMDQTLIFTLEQAIQGPIMIMVMIISIIQMNLYFLIVYGISFIILIVVFYYIKALVIHSKQLDLRLKTPVFNKLNQTSSGLIQLRLFSNQLHYLKDINRNITNSFRGTIFYWFNTRLMGISVSYVATAAIIVSLLIGIKLFDNPGLYATAVIYLQIILQFMQWCFRNLANAQSIMVSVARSFAMIEVESQKQLYIKDVDNKFLSQIGKLESAQQFEVNNSQQQFLQQRKSVILAQDLINKHQSEIVFKDFKMKYRPELPLVLKGVDFEIYRGEKVGIVGRTGAGKSSIIQSLLRICEPEENSVYKYRNTDALSLGLHTLRHQISVIPQSSSLFRDTIRTNLDPFNTATEEQLWDALENSNLRKFIQQLPQGLETQVANNSDVFSVGQKQLFCLSRALLRNNQIVVLDQATSHVDKATDRFVQTVLRKKFQGKTVITIAHRLLTIADYDKVIVMGEGKVLEIGHPYQLYKQKRHFYEMVQFSKSSVQQIVELAKKSYQNKND